MVARYFKIIKVSIAVLLLLLLEARRCVTCYHFNKLTIIVFWTVNRLGLYFDLISSEMNFGHVCVLALSDVVFVCLFSCVWCENHLTYVQQHNSQQIWVLCLSSWLAYLWAEYKRVHGWLLMKQTWNSYCLLSSPNCNLLNDLGHWCFLSSVMLIGNLCGLMVRSIHYQTSSRKNCFITYRYFHAITA